MRGITAGADLKKYKTSIHEWSGLLADTPSQRTNKFKIAGRMLARKLGHALGMKDDFLAFNETTGIKVPRFSEGNMACTNQRGVMDDPADRPGYPLAPSTWTRCSREDLEYYMRGRNCLQCKMGEQYRINLFDVDKITHNL